MKKIAISLAIVASAILSACQADTAPPAPSNVEQVDDECPRADGEPCR